MPIKYAELAKLEGKYGAGYKIGPPKQIKAIPTNCANSK